MKLKQKKWSSTLGSLDLWSFQLRLCLPIQISNVLLFVCWLEGFFRCSYRSFLVKSHLDFCDCFKGQQTNKRAARRDSRPTNEKNFSQTNTETMRKDSEERRRKTKKDFPDLEENLRLPSITRLFAYEITEWCCMGTGRKEISLVNRFAGSPSPSFHFSFSQFPNYFNGWPIAEE